ncbi:hypothetical protein OESDEN_25636 [Oesophagostomum dentatum]|uniref:ABC transmembrane type-1 domain-containing protein n=1 Tax=Oesophagostomum dentatum TaxID=61180 RepID=A0A0B1RNY8_OESDE|nr:hypothetical protein OESDEN_25636 [Oesophagostomum dentatum]
MFSQSVAHLYSHLTKPILDIALISFTLIRYAARRGAGKNVIVPALLATSVITATATLLKKVSPRFVLCHTLNLLLQLKGIQR